VHRGNEYWELLQEVDLVIEVVQQREGMICNDISTTLWNCYKK
jgi:hypothetical protein